MRRQAQTPAASGSDGYCGFVPSLPEDIVGGFAPLVAEGIVGGAPGEDWTPELGGAA